MRAGLIIAGGVMATGAYAGQWTQFAGGADRVAVVTESPGPITTPAWVLYQTDTGEPVTFELPTGVAVDSSRVYAVGVVDDDDALIAGDRADGSVEWTAPLAFPPANDSWSAPAVDGANGAVLLGVDFDLIAFDAATGAERWDCPLYNEVVNASPAITGDLGPADRAFIVDYDPNLLFGGGWLYCVNIDPYDAALNPYLPGDLVWSVQLGGTSGNTPAYRDGVVYVADAGTGWGTAGHVYAFDATATSPPTPLWTFTNTKSVGFYGGVAVHEQGGQSCVYAASYAFAGAQDSANLVRIDAASGQLAWSADSNRTDAIPIPMSGGRVVLSTGLISPPGFPDYGSRPAVQVFRDHGSWGELEWDSTIETWMDADNDGEIDAGEFESLGGWTHQPVLIDEPGCARLIVGTMPDEGPLFAPYAQLSVVDLDLGPSDPNFVAERFLGAGSSPAVAGDAVYTIGPAGLFAFDSPPPGYDVNGDGAITVEDLYAWYAGQGDPDVDHDGQVTPDDRVELEGRLRKHERLDMGWRQGG